MRLNGREGFINRQGEIVIAPKFSNVSDFSEGLAAAEISPGKWGYIDRTGEWVITPQFAMAGSFGDGLANVRYSYSDPYGYIDRSGTLVIPQRFDSADRFDKGIARVGVQTYVDKVSQVLFPADVGLQVSYYYIDKTGKKVEPPAKGDYRMFPEVKRSTLRPIKIDGKMGFVDQAGQIAIAPQFDYVYEFENGLALFTVDGGARSGYVDESGRIIWGPSK